MKEGTSFDWLDESPWWKRALEWLGWCVLSLLVAAGYIEAPVFALVGFASVWSVRFLVSRQEFGVAGFIGTAFTIGGLGLFLIYLIAPNDQNFWSGFTLAAALLGACIFYQIQKAKRLEEQLEHEIYYSNFEWYREQRLEKDQKEYDEWLKTNPN